MSISHRVLGFSIYDRLIFTHGQLLFDVDFDRSNQILVQRSRLKGMRLVVNRLPRRFQPSAQADDRDVSIVRQQIVTNYVYEILSGNFLPQMRCRGWKAVF